MFTTNVNAMNAHAAWMATNAHNVANVNTEDFNALKTTIESGPRAVTQKSSQPTDLTREIPEQIIIERGFEAQTSAIKTQDKMLGTLLDMKG